MEAQICTVQTPKGEITYQLTRKKVRNLNLRISMEGTISVSAARRVPKREIEAFIASKADWILKTRAKLLEPPRPEAPAIPAEECLALFTRISDEIYPLFADVLGGEKPELRVRTMKTRWGVCHVDKRRIVLNTRLAAKPLEAIEYVVLHEYVHFIHPNHQAGFHAEMARLMPDYRARRKLLHG